MATQVTSRIPRSALVLGWLGVIPFAALALLAVAGGVLAPGVATAGLITYAMVILAFMGGAQWGLAMRRPDGEDAAEEWRLFISVVLALAAVGISSLPAVSALLGLTAAFLALLCYDLLTARAGMAPIWYPALRIQLTGAVILCLLFAAQFGLK